MKLMDKDEIREVIKAINKQIPEIPYFEGECFNFLETNEKYFEKVVEIVEKWAKEHPAGEQHKTEERYIKLTPDSVEFVATAGEKTRSLKIVEQATEKYDPILAVLREYAPPDEIAYYLEHGETKGQMLQRIENSVTVEECGFEK